MRQAGMHQSSLQPGSCSRHEWPHAATTQPRTLTALPAASAASSSSSSRQLSAFRDAPVSHSCSVDTAAAALTAPVVGNTAAAQHAVALPWHTTPAISNGHNSSAVDAGAAAGSRHAGGAADTVKHAVPLQLHTQQQPSSAASQRPQTDTWRAQHAAAISQWRLLSAPGQDDTSAVILACSNAQQLLGVARSLLSASGASKWHHARVAAMAAVLTAPHTQSSSQATQEQHAIEQPGTATLQHSILQAVSSSISSSSVHIGHTAQLAHLAHRQQQQQEPQAQQPQLSQELDDGVVSLLACRVLEALCGPCANSSNAPTLHCLWGVPLAETLHAVSLLQQQQQHVLHQPQWQALQRQLASLPDAALLSAVHGCSTVSQLHSVVQLSATHFRPLHLKAAFLQLARLLPRASTSGSSSSSRASAVSMLERLLALLPQQLAALQPHQCACVLWSLGQLQSLADAAANGPSSSSSGGGDRQLASMQQRLLQGALSGLQLLNPRVCAQLLHGAAKLQLQLPPDSLQVLQQHTQQQLQQCDPQALSCMLWSFATLLPQSASPSSSSTDAWIQAFYDSSWRWLQPNKNGQQQQQHVEGWRHKDTCSCFSPVELAGLLTAVCRLQLQPPSGWLAAVADSSSQQMASFQQQELGLLLWGFARLRYVPPRSLLVAAAARVAQLGPSSFTPQTLSLLSYGVARLQRWHHPQQQQQQQQPSVGAEQRGLLGMQEGWLPGPVQLEAWTAHDLALLAWSLGAQRQQADGAMLASLLQAAVPKLLQQQFTAQGLSMLLWGVGTALHPAAAAGEEPGAAAGSSSSRLSQQQQQQLPSQAVLAGFGAAAAAAVTRHAKALSGHELSSVVWGLGAVSKCTQAAACATAAAALDSNSGSSTPNRPHQQQHQQQRRRLQQPALAECLHLLFCQLLDASEQLTNYQLAAAVQGFSWAQHSRGLDLLHLALQPCQAGGGSASKLQSAQPQELLLLLRGCISYSYIPQGAAWGGVVAAVQRIRHQLQPWEAAQLLYLLGKLQMLSNRQQRQRAAAAAAAEAAAAVGAWQSKQERRRVARMHSEQQQLQRVVLKRLVSPVLLEQLLGHACSGLQSCSTKDVSLMLWALSHLQPQQQHRELDGGSASSSSSGRSDGTGSSHAPDAQAAPAGSATLQPLSYVYQYTLQQLQQFAPGNLATLLYALHRLGAQPDPTWLNQAASQFSAQRLRSMDGQSLAVLVLALAGLNWVPPQPWLDGYAQAVAAADRRGALATTWQRRCISNSLAALNPLAAGSHAWLH